MTTNNYNSYFVPSYVFERMSEDKTKKPKRIVHQENAVRREKPLINAIEKAYGKVRRSVFSDNSSVVSDTSSVSGSVIGSGSTVESWKNVPYLHDDGSMCYLVVVDGDGRYLRPMELNDFINSVGRRDKFKEWKKSSPQNAKNKFNVALNEKGEIICGIQCKNGSLITNF